MTIELWPIGIIFAALFLALVLCICVKGIRQLPHENEDLEEFRRNQQQRSQQHYDVEANNIRSSPTAPSRVLLVKSYLHSHQLQPGESARNLAAALVQTTPETTKSIESSSSSQPQCSVFALWRLGVEASFRSSVRSIQSSIRSAISTGKPECSICLQMYQEGETIAWAKNEECNHMYHEDCILEWLSTHDECPLCRTNLLEGAPDEE